MLIPLVYANYPQVGNGTLDFRLESGNFNSVITTDDAVTRTITARSLPPLSTDLDGDGIEEIILFDSGTVKIYQNSDLTAVTGFTSPCTYVSNMITFDIDGDSQTEIIFACEEREAVYMLNFTYPTLEQKYNLTLKNLEHTTSDDRGEIIVQCGSTDNCVLVFTDRSDIQTTVSNNWRLIARGFNSTSIGASDLVLQEGCAGACTGSQGVFCMPFIPVISYSDFDADGTSEYIFSVLIAVDDNEDSQYLIEAVSVSSALAVTEDLAISQDTFEKSYGGTERCSTNNINKYVTATLVSDFTLDTGEEIVIGYMQDTDEYKIHLWKANGDFIDDYPEVSQADGVILSNPMILNALGDNNKDFCVFGYESADQELDLLCGSESNAHISLGISYESIEYKYDYTGMFNISTSFQAYENLAHAVQTSSETTSSSHLGQNNINLDEVLTSYGVFSLDPDDNFGTLEVPPRRSLVLIYQMPVDHLAPIMSDAENVGLADIIGVSSTNLWYIDDGFSNEGAQIDGYVINPCIDGVWKQNTSVGVQITVVDDSNLDDVSARATLYYGSTKNRTSGWSANTTSGTTFQFFFTANDTISSGSLLLEGRDTENEDDVDSIELTISVGANGVEFGDCTTTAEDLIASGTLSTTNETEVVDAVQNNSITQTVNASARYTGLGTTLMWLLFMAVATSLILLMNKERGEDMHIRGIVAIFVGVIMLIIGVKLQYLSFALISTMVIITLVLGGIWIGRKIFNQSGS